MTHERREEVILIALVVSIVLHVGLMVLVKSQVMTQVVPAAVRVRHQPMRVSKRTPRPEPVRIAAVPDVAPLRDAPAVAAPAAVPVTTAPSLENFKAEVPSVEETVTVAPPKLAATVFDGKPVGRGPVSAPVLPILKVETPKAASLPAAAPEFAVVLPSVGRPAVTPPSAPSGPGSAFLPSKLSGARTPPVAFTPAREVYKKVDAQVVAEEKAAVRDLVDQEEAADLESFVNLAMTSTVKDGWRYFKVMMVPRTTLKVVPKDVVMVIDGSGSIGKDRFGNCRKVAKQILRTATNSDDRFNLVVFRNAFSYAFRTWRDCDAASFAAGDQWLNRQTAHGRTDVFSTISSVLTLPRDPKRPLIALVVTDGDANCGVSDTAEILSKFTALNDGLVSVYMYGVKSSANRELIDVLTHGNRGESFIFEGWRWESGKGMEELSDRFRDPVLSDLRIVFTSGTPAESYPRLLKNLYRGETLSFTGRIPAKTKEVAFSLKGLNGAEAYEGFFKLPFATASNDPSLAAAWAAERAIDAKLGKRR